MTTLYEQALAEAKQVKEVAESNAKRAIINQLTPKIREMIEAELLRESGDVAECPDDDMDVLSDAEAGAEKAKAEATDKMPVGESDVVEMNTDEMEVDDSVKESLGAFLESAVVPGTHLVELDVHRLCDTAANIAASSAAVRESKEFTGAINETISKLHDMYSCAKESADLDEGVKAGLLNKLESHYKALKNLVKESNMNRKTVASRKVSKTVDLNEETLNIKVNLPDDVQLADDAVEVQLPGEDADGGDEMGVPGAEGGDDDMGGLDLGGEDAAPDMGGDDAPKDDDMDEGMYGEGLEFDDDDVIEISEAMLRREIARMKGLAESTEEDDDALPEGKMPVEDFGGGEDDGDPWLDHDVTTEAAKPATKKEPKKEVRTNRASTQPTVSEQVATLSRQLAEQKLFNTKLLCTNRLLQQEGLTAKQKLKIAEALDNAQTEREVKLVYKSLSDQIASMKGKSGLQEGTGARKVIGSASRATAPAGSKAEAVNEGLDTNRWARLAGIL